MPYTIILNQTNIVNDGENNKLVYNFPNSVSFPNHEIAVQNITMYYSWPNINNTNLNNYNFSYTWVVNNTTTTYQVNIPTGLYEVAQINAYLQFIFIKNGTYLINSVGKNQYYAEFLVNSSLYSIQVNTFPVPTSLPLGWSVPVYNSATGAAGWVGYPTQTFNPSLTFPTNFNQLIGYAANFTTSQNTNVGTNLSYLSSVAPQIQPNSSVYLSISNVNNKYSRPSSIIYSISPNVAFGEQIILAPPQFAYNKLIPGTYNEIRLTLLGIDYQPVKILDKNMTIELIIRDVSENLQELSNILTGSK